MRLPARPIPWLTALGLMLAVGVASFFVLAEFARPRWWLTLSYGRISVSWFPSWDPLGSRSDTGFSYGPAEFGFPLGTQTVLWPVGGSWRGPLNIVNVPFWPFILITAAGGGIAIRKSRRTRIGCCPCGYNLGGTPPAPDGSITCPECGRTSTPTPPANNTQPEARP